MIITIATSGLTQRKSRFAATLVATDIPADTLLRHVKIHERETDSQIWIHEFPDDHDTLSAHQNPSQPDDPDSRSLSNVSEGMGIVNTTTSAHIQRALTRSAINSDIDHSASSSALPMEHESSEVDLEVDAGTINVGFTEPDRSIFSVNLLPALGDASTGQTLKHGLLGQEQQVSAWSPLTGMSILGDADYSLDTSDWLLEDEVFDLFDFPNLQTGTLDDEPVNNNSPHVRDLRGVWYVPVANDEIDTAPNLNVQSLRQPSSIRDDIDEAYRADMETVLLPAIRNDPLPSIDLLNVCIRLYFTRINTMLPLIHGPTFRPTPNNTLLVLSICSAGALSMDSGNAVKLGCMLFERVNKSGMTLPWERLSSRHSELARSNLKVATIGQTFALLSKEPTHRMIGNSYHGGMITTARHFKCFEDTTPFELAEDLSVEDLDKTWRAWASIEEMKRLAIILYIQDAELTAVFHQDPILRHNTRPLPAACPAELFAAPTAAAWAVKYKAVRNRMNELANRPSGPGQHHSVVEKSLPIDTRHRPDILNAYATLSGIGASICEFRRLNLLSNDLNQKFGDDLVRWYASAGSYSQAYECVGSIGDIPIPLRLLWHYAFISLTVDLNTLEIAIGREGSHNISSDVHEYIQSWISSPNSRRTLFHALYIQNLIVMTNLGSCSAVHTPRILFSAALCWYCYILYLPTTAASDNMDPTTDEILQYLTRLPETRTLREERDSSNLTVNIWHKTMSSLPKVLAATPAEIKENTLCVLESALRGLGISGISRRFADLIYIFISGEMAK